MSIKNFWRLFGISAVFLLVSSIVFARNVQEIEADLRHGTTPVRLGAVREISSGNFSLWEIAIKDDDPAVRLEAIKIADKFPASEVLPVIVRYLNDRINDKVNPPEVISEVEKYLQQQKFTSPDIDLLKELAVNNPDIAAKILPVIVKIAPEKVTDLFLQSFISGNDFVRLSLAKSLKVLNREYVRKILGDYLDDELPEIRLAAARSLLEMQAWPYLPKIVRLLNERRPEIHSQVKEIIQNCPKVPENAVFWSQALSPDLPVDARMMLVEAIGECKNPQMIPVIGNYLFDRNYEVRQKSSEVILRLADDSWRMYFIEKLFSKKLPEREIAVEYLFRRKDFSFCLFALKALGQENNPELREKLMAIAVNNADRPFPEISEMLFSPSGNVRRTVLQIIANLKLGMYLDILLKYQRWEKKPELQKELLNTLGAIGTPAATEIVSNFLLSKNPEIARQAIMVVEKIGNYTSLNNLLFLLDSKNEEIAEAVRPALDKLIDENSFSYVWTLTQSGVIPPVARIYVLQKAQKFVQHIPEKEIKTFFVNPNDDIVLASLELARLKAESSAESRKELLVGIIPLLSHRNENVRQNAAKFLQNFGDEETARKIFLRVTEEKNDTTRQLLLRLLGRFPNEDYFPVMLKLFSSEDGLTRQLALEVLLSSPRLDYFPFIVSRLQDSENTVRMLAARYLGRLRSPKLVKPLVDFVRQENSPQVLAEGLLALGEVGVPQKEVLDVGMNSLTTSSALVQQAAMTMLDKLLSARDSDFLVRALSSSNPTVRQYALKKIGEFKLTTAMPVLCSLLSAGKSGDSEEEKILNALEKILDWSNISALEKIYPDTNKKVRLWILSQVGKFPAGESRRIVLYGLRENDVDLRQQAVEASENIADKEIVQQLEYLANKDDSATVRTRAATVLKQLAK